MYAEIENRTVLGQMKKKSTLLIMLKILRIEGVGGFFFRSSK